MSTQQNVVIIEVDKSISHIHEGYAKHPCIHVICSHGLAMVHVKRYRCRHIRIEGAPLYTHSSKVYVINRCIFEQHTEGIIVPLVNFHDAFTPPRPKNERLKAPPVALIS